MFIDVMTSKIFGLSETLILVTLDRVNWCAPCVQVSCSESSDACADVIDRFID
jgi:hypothetical protein